MEKPKLRAKQDLQVIGVGLSKTGTTSLAKALESLGYRVVDCPLDWKDLAGQQAATDSPVAMWFRQGKFDQVPDLKIILTLRDLDSWLESCEVHWQRKPSFDPVQFPALHEMRQYFYGGQGFCRWRFADAYCEHWAAVRGAVPNASLLEYRLCAGAGWEPLCEFLGKPVPDLPFPWENQR